MTSGSSLCPGFKQVDAFGPDDDYDEEEVAYVTLDLGSIEPTLVPSSSTYRLIGLDTPTPFLQLSGTILKGRHETLLGTELLFTDGKGPSDSLKKTVTHVANTEQRVYFHEVRLHPKGTLSPPGTSTSKGKSKDISALEGWVDEADASSIMVDRVTGKHAPRARAPRRSVGGASSEAKGGASGRQTRARKAKGKGKAKAKAKADDNDYEEVEEGMEVDGGDDDIYAP